MARRNERGDIVVGWLTKIVIVLAVVGVVAFEAVAIGVAHVGTQDVAGEAARAGSAEYSRSRDVQRAYIAASTVAGDKGGTIEPSQFEVQPDGTVQVTVRRDATSILLYRFEATSKWVRVEETASARFVG